MVSTACHGSKFEKKNGISVKGIKRLGITVDHDTGHVYGCIRSPSSSKSVVFDFVSIDL